MQIESKIVSKFTYWGSILVLGAILGVSLQYASAAWTAPAAPAPTGNVNGPITTSATTQTKAGKIQTAATVSGDTSSTLVTKGYLEANYVGGASPQQVRGGHYGGCYQQRDSGDYVVYGGFRAWPVTSCPSYGSGSGSGRPSCDTGYSLIILSSSQGNTGATGHINDLLDTYWVTFACAKT